jgi:hypothetical protein
MSSKRQGHFWHSTNEKTTMKLRLARKLTFGVILGAPIMLTIGLLRPTPLQTEDDPRLAAIVAILFLAVLALVGIVGAAWLIRLRRSVQVALEQPQDDVAVVGQGAYNAGPGAAQVAQEQRRRDKVAQAKPRYKRQRHTAVRRYRRRQEERERAQ